MLADYPATEEVLGVRKTLLSGIFAALVLSLSMSSAGASLESAPAQPPNFVAGEILVKFKPGTPGQVIAAVHQQNGGQVRRTIQVIDVQVVGVPAGQEINRVAAYSRNPNVLYAEVNGFWDAIVTSTGPNDPMVGQQWQYNNTGQTGGTLDADIDAFEAWGVTSGSSGVRIAVLDTGIDQSHEDLKKIVNNVNFSGANSVDDKYGHGTHVAGSAAASTNNSIGVAGTCPTCSLDNVKVLNDRGSGAWDGIAQGIVWAADHGSNVINMSLGGTYDSQAVREAVNAAWDAGVVIVAAAGNDGVNESFYPARYDHVIAVAATDANDAKAGFSNFGADWVDVAAPGSSILSTAPDHSNRIWGTGVKYGTISGTSMASPHVAGLAGLVWSTGACPDNGCVRSDIELNADSIEGTGSLWAHGRINAYSSVSSGGVPPSPVLTVTNLTVSPSPFSPNGDGVADSTSIKFSLNKAASWTIDIQDGTSTVQTFSGTTSDAVTVSQSWDGKDGFGKPVTDGTYTVAVSATAGTEPASATTSVIVDTAAPAGVSVTSISPNSLKAGTFIGVTIKGTGFASSAAVTFKNGGGSIPLASNVNVVGPSTITATVSVAKSVPTPKDRVWDVEVTSNGASGILVDGFTVLP